MPKGIILLLGYVCGSCGYDSGMKELQLEAAMPRKCQVDSAVIIHSKCQAVNVIHT